MPQKKVIEIDTIKTWEQSHERGESEDVMAYYMRFRKDYPKTGVSYWRFKETIAHRDRGRGKLGLGEQGGKSKLIREWVAVNNRLEGESIVDYHARCEVDCTIETFQYAIRYSPNSEQPYKEKRLTELPKRGTHFKEGQKVSIYRDYIKQDVIEGDAELTEFVERGQPLIISGVFVCVEIWNVRFSDGFEARRRLLCK